MIGTLITLLPIFLGVVGAGLLVAAGLIPYEWVRHWLDRFAADGSADAYTVAIHAGIVGRLRVAALSLMLLAILLYTVRQRLTVAGRAFAASAAALTRDVVHWIRHAWSDASTGHRVALLGTLGAGIGIRLWLLPGVADPLRRGVHLPELRARSADPGADAI